MNQRSEFALRAMKTDNFGELYRENGSSARHEEERPARAASSGVLARAGLVEKKRRRAARECGRICSGALPGRCEPQPVREAFERLFEKHGLRGAIRSR